MKKDSAIRRIYCIFLTLVLLLGCDRPGPVHGTQTYPQDEAVPEFMDTATNITVHKGDTALLPCSLRNLGSKQVTWKKAAQDHFLTIGKTTWVKNPNVKVEHELRFPGISDWHLRLKAVSMEDAGVYECQVTATARLHRLVQLTVLDQSFRANYGTVVSGRAFVDLDELIHLKCRATADRYIPEDIDWFKNGDRISSSRYPRISIDKFRDLEAGSLVSDLTIQHATNSDSGMYICRSSEESIDSIRVTVLVADTNNSKRDTPTGVTNAIITLPGGASQCRGGHSIALLTSLWAIWSCFPSLAG